VVGGRHDDGRHLALVGVPVTTRTKGRRSTARRRPPKRSLTISLGPSAPARRTHHGPPAWLVLFWIVRWVSRWVGRAAGWAGRQAIRRSAGHVSRARHAWAVWSGSRAEHGFRTPIIWDHDGTPRAAHKVDLETPTGGDPEVRGRQDDDALRFLGRAAQARADNIFRHSRPPWWQRQLAKIGLWRIKWDVWEESLRARYAVLAQRRERLAREQSLFGVPPNPVNRTGRPAPPGPPPVPSPWPCEDAPWSYRNGNGSGPSLVTVAGSISAPTGHRPHRTRGDGSMANPIRSWGDLAEPNIHPLEFPEELPEHFAQVAKLLSDEAAIIEAAAESAKKGSEIFDGYTEYLNTAQVDGSVIGLISDANENIGDVAELIRRAAQAMDQAASLAEQAQRAAEAVYGGMEMPRFDQANAG
jgi:hypothetical protein